MSANGHPGIAERLAGMFVELGAEETEAVPLHLLSQHPIIQDCLHMIFVTVLRLHRWIRWNRF
ncbi:hypothetical protein P5673_021158 [Acropora cervicornis]|uniref:Uncharacterized protein n=1 Tax=Acropora cervicornis TaxID=6130 RepID=A0AAD9Q929_ACRCE|nr:hypothetical protein P5673_021158 [Acropora cervicornis]